MFDNLSAEMPFPSSQLADTRTGGYRPSVYAVPFHFFEKPNSL